ncbi:MAG: AI-2E family transporter [Spirochaetales bacterium]
MAKWREHRQRNSQREQTDPDAPEVTEATPDGRSLDNSERFSSVAFFLTLALVTVLAGLVAAPVLIPLILAAITAGLADPLKLRIDRLLGERRRLSSALTLLAMVLVVLAPLFVVAFFTGRALVELLTTLTQDVVPVSNMIRDGIESLRGGALDFVFGEGGLANIDQILMAINESLGSLLGMLTQFAANVPNFILMLLIYLYSLYFFLLDGRALVREASSAIPLRRAEKRDFGSTFLRVSRATLKGTLVIGGLQGIIGGVVFWILGLPAPLVFGVLFALLAAIPNFGAILVWLPASIILFVIGDSGKAILMLVLGGGLIAGVDYLVRPLIIRGDAQLHQVLALSGIIGGLALFGLLGLLLGPVVMALFVATWKTFRGRYRSELRDVASGKA